MLRRRAARNSDVPTHRATAVPASKFPADRLPSELIHLVFARLKPTEAAAFRWAGKAVAEVGLQYLAPTVYLRLQEESYDRLLAIAEHPVVSKSVKCLLYQADTLEVRTREQWERCVVGPEYLQAQQITPGGPGVLTIMSMPRHTYSEEQMDRAFSVYQTLCADEENVRQQDFFPQKVAQALKNLSNIKCVSSCILGVSRHYAAEIEKVLGGWYFSQEPGDDLFEFDDAFDEAFDKTAKAADISLVRSIFHGVDQAHIQLETFCSGNKTWLVFEHDKDFEALKRSVRSLKNLTLKLPIDDPCPLLHYSRAWLEAPEFGACLQNGGLPEFLRSAPDLTSLDLSVELYGFVADVPFEYIIGDFHWTSLQTVKLGCVEIEEEHLLGFCRRHSATLKHLTLGSLFMRKGSWFSMFQRMRRMLKLEDAALCGMFYGGGKAIWPMDPDKDEEQDLYFPPGYVIRQYLLSYDGEDVSVVEYLEDFGIA